MFCLYRYNQIAAILTITSVKIFSGKLPALTRKKIITSIIYGTQTSKNILVGDKNRCTSGTLDFAKCPNFSTHSQVDLNFHMTKNHSSSQSKTVHKCQICHHVFASFYSLNLQTQKLHNTKSISKTKYRDVI